MNEKNKRKLMAVVCGTATVFSFLFFSGFMKGACIALAYAGYKFWKP